MSQGGAQTFLFAQANKHKRAQCLPASVATLTVNEASVYTNPVSLKSRNIKTTLRGNRRGEIEKE